MSTDDRRTAAAQLAGIADGFAADAGGPPALAELLEVLGWAVPAGSDALTGPVPVPLVFTARLAGNKRYSWDGSSRTGELGDALLTDASDVLAALADSAAARDGAPLTAAALAKELTAVLHAAGPALADVDPASVTALGVDVPRRKQGKPVRGDVLALPSAHGGWHLALVLERNRIGTALGLLRGVHTVPRTAGERPDVVLRPVFHTDDAQVTAGVWRKVGHDENLLALFPAEPEIYHGTEFDFPGVDLGEYGAAESVEEGELRLVGKEEAEEVGLLDDTYRQAWMSEHLQELLDDGTLPGARRSPSGA